MHWLAGMFFVGNNVTTNIFSKFFGVTIHIQQIIFQLKCQSKVDSKIVEEIRIFFEAPPIMAPHWSEQPSKTAVFNPIISRYSSSVTSSRDSNSMSNCCPQHISVAVLLNNFSNSFWDVFSVFCQQVIRFDQHGISRKNSSVVIPLLWTVASPTHIRLSIKSSCSNVKWKTSMASAVGIASLGFPPNNQ